MDMWWEIIIHVCARVKTWLCQGSRMWPKYDVTRRQRSMRALVSFTLQRNLCTNMHRTQLLGYSPPQACSGWLAGFISTCFYSSKPRCIMYKWILENEITRGHSQWEFVPRYRSGLAKDVIGINTQLLGSVGRPWQKGNLDIYWLDIHGRAWKSIHSWKRL